MMTTIAVKTFLSMSLTDPSGNRVVSSGMERVAAAHAPNDEPKRSREALPLKRLLGVRRAAGFESACAGK